MNSEAYEYIDGVAVIFRTLNNEKDIEKSLSSIKENNPDQIILVDGGSIDNTQIIAKKYIDEVYVVQRGMGNQQSFGLSKVKYKYFVQAEADHVYPRDFIYKLLIEYKESNLFGLQASLICTLKRNFFEKGISVFYDIHQLNKGVSGTIGGPSIYKTKDYIQELNLESWNGYAIDTRRAEILKEKNLKVGLGYTEAYQHQKLDYKIFFKKYFNYGKGDYDFYNYHKKNWSFKRKLKSITHVFNRYIIDYPLKAIKMGKVLYVPYFWFSAIFRYAGWAWAIIKGK
jgi:glycosyltransferase involved in cell wall biosynthesis